MYSEVLSVPLLVKWPQGTRADAHIRHTVCLTDLTATFLELAGVRDRQGVRGRPLPRQDSRPGDQVYAEGLLYGKEQTALVTDQFKVVYHPFADSQEEQFEVYDLQRDPAERHNLAATDATAQLRAQLKERSDHAHTLALEWQRKLAAGSSRFRLSEDAKRSLRSLGYMGK
jgi:arylsulfatase A-like enzyme